jgi:hypothetical protein
MQQLSVQGKSGGGLTLLMVLEAGSHLIYGRASVLLPTIIKGVFTSYILQARE